MFKNRWFLLMPALLIIACSGLDNDEQTSKTNAAVKDQENNDEPNSIQSEEISQTSEDALEIYGGFLTQKNFKDENVVKASSTENEMRRYLLAEVSFKNPLYEHNEAEQVYISKILSKSHCPDNLWPMLKAQVKDTNTLVVDSVSENGYSIEYECSRQPSKSLIQLKTSAKIKGNFYYQINCPNTDLTQYDGQTLEVFAPLFPGQNPKVCPDDSERTVLMQYEFDLVTDSSFTLATGSRDRTVEHNLSRYAFGSKADISKPCKITKEDDSYGITDCKQLKWKQLLSYEGWTNGEPDVSTSNDQGNETLSYETLEFDKLSFSGSISAYQQGIIHFSHNDIKGSVTYTPNALTSYKIDGSESGSLVIPWQRTIDK